MKFPKGIFFMVLAGVVGLVAMYTVHHYVSARTKVVVKPMSQVVVATADISPGTQINKGLAKIVSWPRELTPPKALANLGEVEGRIVSIPVTSGEPILLSKLAPEGASAGLAALLDNGKRALTVRVDDVSGVAGFIHPGDHVDVLAEMAIPESKLHFSKTILQNIVVLTAGQIWEQVRDQKPAVVNTVTLVLTTDQAEILNLASNQGRIRLTLRNRNDVGPVTAKGVDISQLIGAKKVIAPKAPDNHRNVEMIKGLDRSQANL